jgi:hypothetical protein
MVRTGAPREGRPFASDSRPGRFTALIGKVRLKRFQAVDKNAKLLFARGERIPGWRRSQHAAAVDLEDSVGEIVFVVFRRHGRHRNYIDGLDNYGSLVFLGPSPSPCSSVQFDPG